MSTIERDASSTWKALESAWSDFSWEDAVYSHGAFHHVAVLGSSGVVRVSFARDHEAQIARHGAILRTVSSVGLTTSVPKLLRTFRGGTWSAMACTFIKGAHDLDRPWEEVRHHFAGILEDLRSAQVSASSLPSARTWCGGESWSSLVEHIVGESSPAVQDAARTVVKDVIGVDGTASSSLVHGDLGPHNILWDTSNTPRLIDFDNACVADPAIDVAPLIGFYGAAKVGQIVDADVLTRAKIHRASLPLQVAAAAALSEDRKLQRHALLNFTQRLEAGSLQDPAAAS